MKIKALNIAQVVAGTLLIVLSLSADFFVPGYPGHGIGLIQKAGALAGLLFAVFGLIPSAERATPCSSACRPRISICILVSVLVMLLIVPKPFHTTNKVQTILNLSHIPIFIFLSIAVLQFYACFHWPVWLRITIPLGLVVFVGLATELIQAVVPGRWASFGDFKLDVIGIIYGSLLFFLFRKWEADVIRRLVCE